MGIHDWSKKQLEEELKCREKEEARLAALPVEKRLAEKLHDLLCHWNHTDGCSWGYEDWNNVGHARRAYLKKARLALAVASEPVIIQILKAVR